MSRKSYLACVEYIEHERDDLLVNHETVVLEASTPIELQGKINAMLIKLKPSTEEEILAMIDRALTVETTVDYYY